MGEVALGVRAVTIKMAHGVTGALAVELDACTGVLTVVDAFRALRPDDRQRDGHVLRWILPTRSLRVANNLITRLALPAWTIVAGYTSCEGGAEYTDRAKVAIDMIRHVCGQVKAS